MGDWQPIETAPKDGTEVLIWNDLQRPRIARYERDMWVNDDGFCESLDEPTHWMPLPDPPA